jgi:hypothetical protein
MKRLLVLTLMSSVIAFAAGCAGTASNKRPYAASEAVLVFEDAVWAEEGGRLVLKSARWRAEKEMTVEDVRYNFRRGAVLTPGFLAAILDKLEAEK